MPSKEIGPLEMRVLGILSGAEPRSVQEIQVELGKSGPELAYTTVMTVLVRLFEKGLVKREKEGRRFVYAVAQRTPAAAQGLMKRIQRTLFAKDRTQPILSLLDDGNLSEADLRALRRKIDEKLKGKS